MQTHKVVAYCRLASQSRTKSDVGMRTQRKKCHEYARKKGWHISKVIEEYESGLIVDRLGLVALLDFCRDFPGTTVVVTEPSRLARRCSDAQAMLELVASTGSVVKFTTKME
jgi:DNA invertase Pin-like site-specific DNA recombinase